MSWQESWSQVTAGRISLAQTPESTGRTRRTWHSQTWRKKEMVPCQGRKRTSNIPLTFWRLRLLLLQDFPTPRLHHWVLVLGLPVYMTETDRGRPGETKQDNRGKDWLESTATVYQSSSSSLFSMWGFSLCSQAATCGLKVERLNWKE